MLLILLLLSSLLVLSLSLSSNIQCNRNIIKYNSNIIKKYDHQHYTRLNMLEENDNGFTTKQVLKEETEAPFRSLRKFIYFGLLAGAGLGTTITMIKLLVPNSNDNINELYYNLGINSFGVVVLLYLLNRENTAQQALLERIKKGGSLAGLRVRLASTPTEDVSNLVVKLSDLRRDRGIEKRVVIVCAPKELLKTSLQTSINESKNLIRNDLLICPLLIEKEDNDYKLTASSLNSLVGGDISDVDAMEHLGLPIGLQNWNQVIKYEMNTAIKQVGLDSALDKGITIVLKKNGKVGSRRFGVPLWSQLTNDIEQRAALGLDVSNI